MTTTQPTQQVDLLLGGPANDILDLGSQPTVVPQSNLLDLMSNVSLGGSSQPVTTAPSSNFGFIASQPAAQ